MTINDADLRKAIDARSANDNKLSEAACPYGEIPRAKRFGMTTNDN
jgi:hypothetical protein